MILPVPRVTADPRVDRRFLRDAGLYALGAAVAIGAALSTTNTGFLWWGRIAMWGYLLGVIASLLATALRASARWRVRVLTAVSCAVALLPLLVLVAVDVSVSEVRVLQESAVRLLHEGTPYADPAELARLVADRGSAGYTAYNVYMPALTLYGVPSALLGAGPLTDPRLFMAGTAIVVLLATRRIRRSVLLVLAIPPVALGLAIGSNDLPVLAFVCLGLILAAEGRVVGAGAAVGLAAAMKALAWPVVPVVLVLSAIRNGTRATARAAAAMGAVVAACVVPVLLVDPHALVANVIRMPLQLEPVRTMANSPGLGGLLADLGPGGRAAAVALLVAVAGCLLVWLLVRPPLDARQAARFLAAGWLLAIVLAPSTRYGYVVYPAVVLVMAYAAALDRNSGALPIGGSPRIESVPS